MTTNDWIIDLALIALVLRQLHESRLDRRFFLLPLGLVGYTAAHYLRELPTAGHDLWLIAAGIAAGALLGALSGAATRVRVAQGATLVRAGGLAAGLWVLGTGTRLTFQLYASHGGAGRIETFSRQAHITTQVAWLDALLLMALAEVAVRLSVIGVRAHRATHTTGAPSQLPQASGLLAV